MNQVDYKNMASIAHAKFLGIKMENQSQQFCIQDKHKKNVCVDDKQNTSTTYSKCRAIYFNITVYFLSLVFKIDTVCMWDGPKVQLHSCISMADVLSRVLN